MKETIKDANFPKTSEGRVYHLGLKHGELANRILTVGDPARALKLAEYFDGAPGQEVIRIESERGFLTLTGVFKGVPISIVAIGMGFPNMDFFVRECRECLDGDMFVIRFGSCGSISNVPVGSVVVPRASVAITRDYDFDFHNPPPDESAYRISKPVSADPRLHSILVKTLTSSPSRQSDVAIIEDGVNASADSFYSSQGRITSFADHNNNLLNELIGRVKGVVSLEMETFHLYHLASVYRPLSSEIIDKESDVPPSHLPAETTIIPARQEVVSKVLSGQHQQSLSQGRIYACAAQMIFASRLSNDFITPDGVQRAQSWAGLACLEALTQA